MTARKPAHAGRPLRILILRDRRPGHFNQSEGVAAALARLAPVTIIRTGATPRRLLPQRVLRRLLARGTISAATMLRLAYREPLAGIARPDIIISAGGATLLANAGLARLCGAANIFSGSLRGLPGAFFSAVLIPYRRFASSPHHIVCLKPSPLDPDRAAPASQTPKVARATLLVGGPSGTHHYETAEWRVLVETLPALAAALNWRWTIVTSPRTPAPVRAMVETLCETHSKDFTLVDYRDAGPGSSFSACLNADTIFVTEDSNSMITEAIVARRPVIALAPHARKLAGDELEYLEGLVASGWLRTVPIASLNEATVRAALGEVTPMRDNHLELLAQALRRKLTDRLPQLAV